ncbi:MAG: hypothetical protein O9301_12155 [Leptospira sp.]|nr:hypothetical protein [Leptospira sp.]
MNFLNSHRGYYFLILLFLYYLLPFASLFQDSTKLGGYDWDQHLFYLEFLRKSHLEYDTIPFWNPYYGGGFPVFENPSSKVLSLTHLLTHFFDSLTSLKLIFIFYFLSSGILNYFCISKLEKNKPIFSILFVIIFHFSGFFFQRLYVGHANLFPAFFLPTFCLSFLLFVKSLQKKYAMIWISVIYILLSEGAIYILTQGLFLVSFLAIPILIKKKNLKITFLNLAVLFFLTGCITYIKWAPSFFFIQEYGRYFKPDLFTLQPFDYYNLFIGSSQHPVLSKSIHQMQYNYWEYGNYIGFVPFFLLVCLPYWKLKRRSTLVLAIVTLLLMAGNFGLFSPIYFLEQLPIYSMERVHPRWSVSFVFLFSWFLSTNLQKTNTILKKLYPKLQIFFAYFILILIAVHSYDTKKINTKYVKEIFQNQFPEITKNPSNIPTTLSNPPSYGADSEMYPALVQNYSSLSFYENLNLYFRTNSPSDKDYLGEFWLFPDKVDVTPIFWSPDRVGFAKISKEKLLIFNQKYYRAFTSSNSNLIVCSWNGFLAVYSLTDTDDFEIFLDPFKSLFPFGIQTISCPSLRLPD